MRGDWKRLVLAGAAVMAAALVAACGGGGNETAGGPGGSMILATTTSTQDSGLLDVLVPLFRERTGVEVKVIAVGTGAALEMARKGDADAVLTHALASEQKLVESGDLVEGALVMHNDFVLVGPPGDPAGVRGAGSAAEAMRRIAAYGRFVSRGDNSGTHQQELATWQAAGIDPGTVAMRVETGQGMGATLNVADQLGSYTLTDRGTYLALRKNLQLAIVFEGARELLNVYHTYVVNPERHPGVKAEQARAWTAFLVSKEAQEAIRTFGVERYGEPLFFPDAGKALDEVGK